MRGFPGWSHLIATIAFPTWIISGHARGYGIDTSEYNWWQGFNGLGPLVVIVVLIVILPPAATLEAWAVLGSKRRWVARIIVIGYVLIAGFVTFAPAGLRFWGDMSPTPMHLVTLSLVAYGIVIGAQVLLVYVICRLWRQRARNAA